MRSGFMTALLVVLGLALGGATAPLGATARDGAEASGAAPRFSGGRPGGGPGEIATAQSRLLLAQAPAGDEASPGAAAEPVQRADRVEPVGSPSPERGLEPAEGARAVTSPPPVAAPADPLPAPDRASPAEAAPAPERGPGLAPAAAPEAAAADPPAASRGGPPSR